MIKTKLNNPKESLVKELKEQNLKFDRIKKAYLNGTFTLEEYEEERKSVEDTISNLEFKIKDCDVCDELRFTLEDILIKRDIDYINKILYPKEYEENTYSWNDYTREEKSNLIMRYVDYVELDIIKGKLELSKVFFRQSMLIPAKELYDAGYLAITDYGIAGNVMTKLRISEYLPFDKVAEIIMTLRQYYNVGYYESTYCYDNHMLQFHSYQGRNIVRVFPLEDYKKDGRYRRNKTRYYLC